MFVAGGGLLLGAVALGVAVAAMARASAVRKAYRGFSRGSSDDVFSALERQAGALEEVRRRLDTQGLDHEELRRIVSHTVSRIATVRYDAFEDMGGELSFSSALLDEFGSGVVLTCINGRNEARTYAKTIREGRSRHNLSAEEAEAIRRAMTGAGAVTGSVDGAGESFSGKSSAPPGGIRTARGSAPPRRARRGRRGRGGHAAGGPRR